MQRKIKVLCQTNGKGMFGHHNCLNEQEMLGKESSLSKVLRHISQKQDNYFKEPEETAWNSLEEKTFD